MLPPDADPWSARATPTMPWSGRRGDGFHTLDSQDGSSWQTKNPKARTTLGFGVFGGRELLREP